MLLGLICGAFLTTAFAVSADTATAASAGAQQDSPRQQNSPDEVIIAAQREKLSHLRAELEKTQIAFYEEFNRINTDPEYETHCRYKSRAASRILERVCTPKFVDTAVEAEAEAFTRNYQDGKFYYAPPGGRSDPGKNAVLQEESTGAHAEGPCARQGGTRLFGADQTLRVRAQEKAQGQVVCLGLAAFHRRPRGHR